MSLSSLNENERDKNIIELFDKNGKNNQSKPLFNSKLFLNLDINQEEDEQNKDIKTKEDSDYSEDLEESNYLSNELIKDLDGSNYLEKNEKNFMNNDNYNKNDNETKNNIINSLISLAKDGYEFKPKNYKPEKIFFKKEEKNFENKNKISNKFNNKFNKRKDNKNDWICPLCRNLNFSFRTICNKCKSNKIS